jgi:hypothetical protein
MHALNGAALIAVVLIDVESANNHAIIATNIATATGAQLWNWQAGVHSTSPTFSNTLSDADIATAVTSGLPNAYLDRS